MNINENISPKESPILLESDKVQTETVIDLTSNEESSLKVTTSGWKSAKPSFY